MTSDPPATLRATLDRLAEGISRADLAQRSTAISDAYRVGRGSEAITTDEDALAYAMVRMPATYAAIMATLTATREAAPDFAPASLSDIGAGPGTAAIAAATCFASLRDIDLLDHNAHLQRLGRRLLAASDSLALQDARYDRVEAGASLPARASADLVIASYVLAEIATKNLPDFVEALWRHTAGTLIVIEPGTPAGFARIRALRERLIALGAHALAPCPHDKPCPIVAPDWCHFVKRLNRSRDHRRVKDVELPYEDEKFAYVAMSRQPAPHRASARVLAAPQVTKIAINAKLCRSDGTIAVDTAPHRDRAAYKARKGWRWGDAVEIDA